MVVVLVGVGGGGGGGGRGDNAKRAMVASIVYMIIQDVVFVSFAPFDALN